MVTKRKPIKRSRRTAEMTSGALAKLPEAPAVFLQPMQPELVDQLPEGSDWQYEVKWDGYRIVAIKRATRVSLVSRNRHDLSDRYPSIAASLQTIHCHEAVLDGEVIALDAAGRPSFQLLQSFSAGSATLVYMAFDLLTLDGHSLLKLPLVERQALLTKVVKGTAVQLSEPIAVDLSAARRFVEKLQLEGIVAKKRLAPYSPGSRGKTWYKYRLGRGQEFVVGGFTAGNPFDGLLLGYYQGRKLVYAGKVKAGFTPALRRIFTRAWLRSLLISARSLTCQKNGQVGGAMA